ncbi:PepSY domain-containing protein [Streptomyces sp. NPDC059524]|uniref:PepSY domain-containing protein n=1 Tax=Streptomyces sp. NPDC059524 TaxID=3346856 RepID=UPI0036D1DB90
MKRRILALSAVAAAVVIGAGTATTVAFAGEDDDDRTSASTPAAHTDRDDDDRDDDREEATSAKAKVSAEDAIAAALRHTPGVATEADLDSDDGRLVWDVDVIGSGNKWHHVEIDPATGKVLGSHVERDDDGDDDSAERVSSVLRDASTSASDAARAASAEGRVTSVDLDDKAWEVETTSANGTDHDWTVPLTSTKVTPSHDD